MEQARQITSSSSKNTTKTSRMITKNLLKLFSLTSSTSSSTSSSAVSSSSAASTHANNNRLKFDSCKKATKIAKVQLKRIPIVDNNLSINRKLSSKLQEFTLHKSNSSNDYGFTIVGYCPCTIGRIEQDSIAFNAGLKQGDCIIKVNASNVTRAASESIVKMIKTLSSTMDKIKLSIYRTNTTTLQNKNNNNNNNNNSISALSGNGVISIGRKINQGDHASMGVINSTENDFLLMSKLHNSQQQQQQQQQENTLQHKFSLMAKNTLESFKSEDFVYCAGGDGISVNEKKTRATLTINNKTPANQINKRTKKISKQSPPKILKCDDDLPSPIPFLPPLKQPKSTLTDSDYKTQTSSITDLYSSTCEQPAQKMLIQQLNTDDDDDDDDDAYDDDLNANSNDDERMDACEKLLNLEEHFIEQMQKGVQQYSRPLRHCMMINSNEHCVLFQNIEKILAISEYQLNQLISQDDSTLIDMFNSIGKLYENKIRMSCEAFDLYLNGLANAFSLLDNLLRTQQFNKFIQDSKEDIEMDLRSFLMLPLDYVEQVYECLLNIKKYTLKTNCDYLSLESLLSSLSIYVNKSKICLGKCIKTTTTTTTTTTTLEIEIKQKQQEMSDNESYNYDDNDDDSNEILNNEDDSISNHDSFKSRFLIYSSQLNSKMSRNKYKKVNTLLFNDILAFTSIKLNEEKLNNIQNYFNFIDSYIYLRDIHKYDFNMENNEFSLVYTKNNKYCRLRLKASSIEEKHTWTKLLIQRIKQSKYSS